MPGKARQCLGFTFYANVLSDIRTQTGYLRSAPYAGVSPKLSGR